MSRIEEARRKLQISGYQHPETIKYSSDKKYKVFNSEDYKTSTDKPKYATFSEKKDSENVVNKNNCLVCEEEYLYVCDCEMKDKQCKNGHVWFEDKSGDIKEGDPHDM